MWKILEGGVIMFGFECLTVEKTLKAASCMPTDCGPDWGTCNPEYDACGPDYGTDCTPDCDPSDDY